MTELVLYAVDGPVARLVLDSPRNRNALSTALVVTNDKFGRNSLERVCGLDELSDIVTDREPQPALRAAIEAAGAVLHIFDGG